MRFATQLSNVYGNAIRAKLATAQTTRSVADSFSSFVTQNLQSICSLYHRHPRFFINIRNTIPLQIHESPPFRHARCQKLFLFPQAMAQQKKKAELFYKERLWVYNYVMQSTKIIQKDYSLSSMNYQLKLPFELEVLIPDITIANLEKDSRASYTATQLPSFV